MSKSIRIGALAALAVAGVLVILWTGLRQRPENLQLSTQQWHEDLQFLARELPKRHANAFHFTPRERFTGGHSIRITVLPFLDAPGAPRLAFMLN